MIKSISNQCFFSTCLQVDFDLFQILILETLYFEKSICNSNVDFKKSIIRVNDTNIHPKKSNKLMVSFRSVIFQQRNFPYLPNHNLSVHGNLWVLFLNLVLSKGKPAEGSDFSGIKLNLKIDMVRIDLFFNRLIFQKKNAVFWYGIPVLSGCDFLKTITT